MNLADIQANWDTAARQDAMGAIMTGNPTAWEQEAFLATGRAEIDAVMAYLDDYGIDPPGRKLALDFGCGVGRLSHALAEYFDEVVGVDLSPEMIHRAIPHDRVSYRWRASLAGMAERFDLIYSNIVLQHMPSDLQRGYVTEFPNLLTPDGLAVFETPEGPAGVTGGGHLSMFGTPEATVEQWVTEAGGRVVGVSPTGSCGPGDFHSRRYVVKRA